VALLSTEMKQVVEIRLKFALIICEMQDNKRISVQSFFTRVCLSSV